MINALEREFDEAMLNIYRRADSEAGYTATMYLRMLNERHGLATAQTLIHTNAPSSGYTHLWERGRLDLTMEALIFDNPKWHPLFTENELRIVRQRLRDYGYPPAMQA